MLFLLSFFALNTFAQSADYTCDVRQYRVDLNLRQDRSTHFWLTDTIQYDVIAQGFAASIEKRGNLTDYFFYPGNASPVMMTFKSEDIVNLPLKLSASIETKVRGFLLRDGMSCSRR